MQNTKTSFYNHTKVENVPIEDLIVGKKNKTELRTTSINIDPQNYNEEALEVYAIEL